MAITINPNIQAVTAPAPTTPASGIGLAIVNQPSVNQPSVNQPSTATTGQASAGTSATSNPVLTLSPSLAASLAANLTPDTITPASPLTQLETLAVSVAAQTAAARQTSLAPLFADLSVASTLPNLPPQVQQAVVQVLAQQTNLDQNLTADAVKQAFQSSGLFLETSLASGAAPLSNGVPDLKAALVVLRETLTSALSDVATTGTAPTVTAPSASTPQPSAPQIAVAADGTTPSAAATSDSVATGAIATPAAASATGSQPATTPAATSVPTEQSALEAAAVVASILFEAEGPAGLVESLSGSPSIAPLAATTSAAPSAPGAASAAVQDILELAAASQNLATSALPADSARAAATSAALNVLQEVLQASPLAVSNPLQFLSENSQALALLPVVTGARTQDEADFARTNLPPPPVNGALPSAQPVAPATLTAHTPLEAALQHLLGDTDGAIARQTLLQIASLPGQADASATRVDLSTPRWNFEIPFATPQGTAMAQFEISRDGAGREATAVKATWRARFSLNVEPAGPVHALVSLNGDRTSVKMWAERPSTASQLRAGVSQLTQALSRAELTPGDIVIREGAPTQPAAAAAGHFLDRAS